MNILKKCNLTYQRENRVKAKRPVIHQAAAQCKETQQMKLSPISPPSGS